MASSCFGVPLVFIKNSLFISLSVVFSSVQICLEGTSNWEGQRTFDNVGIEKYHFFVQYSLSLDWRFKVRGAIPSPICLTFTICTEKQTSPEITHCLIFAFQVEPRAAKKPIDMWSEKVRPTSSLQNPFSCLLS